jgi:hypothetical protein
VKDIIHDNFACLNSEYFKSEYLGIEYLSDILVFSQVGVTLFILDLSSIAELFVIMGITQLFRVVCFTTTILPPLKDYGDKERFLGTNGNGTEYIFSGHAAYSAATFIYLYTQQYVSLAPLLIYNLVSQFLIVASRNHYTVDVILAWIIVPLVWGNFGSEYNKNINKEC